MVRLVICALLCFLPAARGQSPGFEVASIKPNTSGERGVSVNLSPGGRFIAENMSLRLMIQFAYDVQDFQITGGPAWMNADPYDVNAKANGSADLDKFRLMLRSMLADRFQLMLHRETKELTVYELAAAKGGFKFAASKEGSCVPPDPNRPPPPAGGPIPRICGGARIGRGLVDVVGVNMPRLIFILSDTLHRAVVDKTGFTGTFDAHLEFTPDEGTADASDAARPSIFTALQEQLGLKLESAKGPVEVLVIDHVERPSAN